MIVTLNVHCKYFKVLTPFLILFSVITLFWVFFVGHATNGASRWIEFFGIQFQPSEIAKGSVILAVAQILSAMQTEIGADRRAFKYILIVALPITLLIIPENFSTAALLLLVVIMMMIIGRIPTRLILYFVGVLAALGAFVIGCVFLFGNVDKTKIDEENKISFTEACNLYNENIVHKLKVLSKIENNETNLYFCSIDYYIEYIRYTKYVDLTKEELLYIVSTYSNCDFLTGITDIFDIDYDIKEELCIQELNGSLDLASNHPWFGWAPFKTAIYFSIVEKDEIYSEFKNENITAGYWIYIHDYKIDLSEVYKNEKLSNKEKAIKKAKIIAINEFIKNQNVNDKSTLIYFDSELKYDYFLEGSEYLYLLADAYLMLNQTSEKPTLSLNIRKDDRAMAFKDNKVDFSQLKENQKGVFSLYSYKDSLRSFYKQLNENMTVEEFKDWLEIVAELGPGSYYISCTEILMP